MKNIFILPTEKGTGAIAKSPKGLYYIVNDHNRGISDHIDYDVYITFDEEIKEEDWFVHSSHGTTTLLKCKSINSKEIIDNEGKVCWIEYSKKIILTTYQDLIKDGVQAIDDEFLEWFCKNSSCEYVTVYDGLFGVNRIWKKYIIIPKKEPTNLNSQEVMYHQEREEYFYEDFIDGKKITVWLGKDYIPKEEPKQETLEKREPYWELIDKKADTNNTMDLNAYAMGVEDGVKWQAERSFTLEQIDELFFSNKNYGYFDEFLDYRLGLNGNAKNNITFKVWFEQFKKSKV